MPALDYPYIGVIRLTPILLGGQDLEEFGMERTLIEKEGQPTCASLLGSVRHISLFSSPYEDNSNTGRVVRLFPVL